jgi:ABC-2 type transport system ATP-binding protein
MADRVGIISKGEIILVERKQELMRKLGRKRLVIELHEALGVLPSALADSPLQLSGGGRELIYTYDSRADRTGITTLLNRLRDAGIAFTDLRTEESSLEDIFVDLIQERAR